MPVTSYNPDLARKEWGWRRFGHSFGISVVVSRGRWFGLRPRFFRDGKRHYIVQIHFGVGQLWLRFRIGPKTKAQREQHEGLRRLG